MEYTRKNKHYSMKSLAFSDLLFDDIHNRRISDGTEIAKLITFTINNFTHNTTHDLLMTQIVSTVVIFLRGRGDVLFRTWFWVNRGR